MLVVADAEGQAPDMADEEVFRSRSVSRGLIDSLSGRTLHVANGRTTMGVLQEAGVPGKIPVWSDVLHEGPVDRALSMKAEIESRANHIQEMGMEGAEAATQRMRRWYRDLSVVS